MFFSDTSKQLLQGQHYQCDAHTLEDRKTVQQSTVDTIEELVQGKKPEKWGEMNSITDRMNSIIKKDQLSYCVSLSKP